MESKRSEGEMSDMTMTVDSAGAAGENRKQEDGVEDSSCSSIAQSPGIKRNANW
jgi:hypothetical protein